MSETKRSIIKKGEYFIITDGEYSSYGIDGLFKVTKDFDVADLQSKYRAWREEIKAKGLSSWNTSFAKWLSVDMGLLKELHFSEVREQDRLEPYDDRNTLMPKISIWEDDGRR